MLFMSEAVNKDIKSKRNISTQSWSLYFETFYSLVPSFPPKMKMLSILVNHG